MLQLYSFHSVCLTFVSLPVHPYIFSHSSAYRGDRCALVLVMPARLRDAISGILAGGILGFGTATFLLGTSRSSLKCLALSCCFKDDLLRTGHISCLVITFHRCFWIQWRPPLRLQKACRFQVPKMNPLDIARCCSESNRQISKCGNTSLYIAKF